LPADEPITNDVRANELDALGHPDDFWDEAPPAARPDPRDKFGPIFTAAYESDCASCFERIVPGEDIRADGSGRYIHADDQCEEVAVREMR
jgi:hypothetical protein